MGFMKMLRGSNECWLESIPFGIKVASDEAELGGDSFDGIKIL